MEFNNLENNNYENFQNENEINKNEKKIENAKKELEKEDEKKKLKKEEKQKNRENVLEEEEIKQKKEEEKDYEKEEEEDKNSKNGINKKYLEVKFKIELNKEKDEIYKIYEISNKRIAVELDKKIKIYSLKTYQLITEINHDKINNSIELKNNDITITDYNKVYFYKLSGNNYINYLKFDEKDEIYEIYELKNENLVLCLYRSLSVYTKEQGEYKFLSKFELEETVGKILEIKNNTLFLFLLSREGTFETADYSPYYLLLLNVETKEGKGLALGSFSRYDDETVYYGCNLLLKNNKYLFARYAGHFCIFNIEDDDIKKIKCIYKIDGISIKKYFPSYFVCFCDYDDDSFIILSSRGIYKYDEMENKIILKQNIINKFEEMIDIIRLKNNNFIIHSKNEILFINNY